MTHEEAIERLRGMAKIAFEKNLQWRKRIREEAGADLDALDYAIAMLQTKELPKKPYKEKIEGEWDKYD